tara:strand:- start:57826 stop:58539 length:714 start_codon:yes stop_codon:yes gene_type:complete
MKGFRVASEAPTAQHIALTCTQIVVFWSFFLFVLPAAVEAAEHALELPAMALRSPHLIGGILFGLASCVGLLSAMVMAVRGRGTPLPLQTARRFVVSGTYKWVRNPMALAGITQGIAAGIWRDSSLVILYALCGGLLWHNLARPPEERDLEARFGQQFVDYRDRVGIWLPHLGSKAMERFVGITMPIASLVLTFWLPAVQAVPLIATTLLLGGYLAIRPAKSTNSGHSSSKSDSNAT